MNKALSQSAFVIPDTQPEFDFAPPKRGWIVTLALLIGYTAVNLLGFTIAGLFSTDIGEQVKWGCVVQVQLVTWVIKEPLVSLIERIVLQCIIPKQLELYIDVLIATLPFFLEAVAHGLMSLIILAFPTDVLDTWDEHPWTFFSSYGIFILAIFTAMRFVSQVIVHAALYRYGEAKMHSRIRETLQHIVSTFVAVKFTKPMLQQESLILGKWRHGIYSWSDAHLEYTCRRRVRQAAEGMSIIDSNALATRCWSAFRDSQQGYPDIVWLDYADSILVDTSRSTPISTPLISQIVGSEEDLQTIFDNIKKKAKKLKEEIVEQDRLFSQLQRFFTVVNVLLIIFVVLPVLGFKPNAYLIPLGVSITPTVMALTVIFGQSITSIIISITFTFYIHPFDVSDEVRIEKDSFHVRRIGLISSLLENSVGVQVYYPNSVLSQVHIINISRASSLIQRIDIVLPKNESNARKVGTEVIKNLGSFCAVRDYMLCVDDNVRMMINIRHNGESALKQRIIKSVISTTQQLSIQCISSTVTPISI
ncbi:hypothetical protein PSACC_02288 [Paramicrosporidium saccamoebae]|uniref:Uncharacterized protein n=1 Tax=Paramicrosporidium saccamoebae TaxID=1246581 RepID=A0A2H9TJS7_9FUNG|nr:hypothetical protein PSACC_02288 [Paramicrosporidium saccamoebae]